MLFSFGFVIIMYVLCSVILDIYKVWSWGVFFIVFGVNVIFFFMFVGVFVCLLIMILIGDSSLKGSIYGLI